MLSTLWKEESGGRWNLTRVIGLKRKMAVGGVDAKLEGISFWEL
jgi:hypothetical protein